MKRLLLQALRSWRDERARSEGVEPFRILPNATLQAIAEALPKNRDELCTVKGIKEAKFQRYGKALLALVEECTSRGNESADSEAVPRSTIRAGAEEANLVFVEPLTVSRFLDGINLELSGMAARVRGEVSSVSESARAIYFSLKDAEDASVLNCVIFRSAYEVSGVKLAVGDEVIVEGVPEVYKPYGKFSLRVGVIEYAGEGALKKAYDELFRKLESEGMFAPERKRVLPRFAERIALITSADGAAIGDFTMNLGRNGLSVHHFPTAVEGKRAVFEILEAICFFNQYPERYDCLVMIRGGGSLESLAAFNTEALVRAVAASHIPVLAGIGHERDVSLVALAADSMVSTPTAAARLLGTPWEEARVSVSGAERGLIQAFEAALRERKFFVSDGAHRLELHFKGFLETFLNFDQRLREAGRMLPRHVANLKEGLEQGQRRLIESMTRALRVSHSDILRFDQTLRQSDPERLLALGYSLVRSGGHIIRSATALRRGQRLDIQFADGTVQSEVKEINP
jgi:exodeoxyribonuclease VII large subunit